MKTALAILAVLLAGMLLARVAEASSLKEQAQPQRSAAPARSVPERLRASTLAAKSTAALRAALNTASRANSARPPAHSARYGSLDARSPDAARPARLGRAAAGGAPSGRYESQLPSYRALAPKQRPPGLVMLGGSARITRSPPREPGSPYALRR